MMDKLDEVKIAGGRATGECIRGLDAWRATAIRSQENGTEDYRCEGVGG